MVLSKQKTQEQNESPSASSPDDSPGSSEDSMPTTKKTRTNPTRSARATTSERPAADTTLPDPQLEVRLTRDTFIADDHVQIAISNLETMHVLEEDGNDMKEVPIPQSVKESGVLPDGYRVDFAFDPYVALRGFVDGGYIYESDLEKEALDEFKATINDPKNLSIVPTEIWEAKLQSVIETLGPIEDKVKKTPKSRGTRKRKH